jgi:hypothetical protein
MFFADQTDFVTTSEDTALDTGTNQLFISRCVSMASFLLYQLESTTIAVCTFDISIRQWVPVADIAQCNLGQRAVPGSVDLALACVACITHNARFEHVCKLIGDIACNSAGHDVR